MILLLLDPLVLSLYVVVAAYAWWVVSGRFRAWFRADRLWLGFWPLPLVVTVAPLLVGPVLRVLEALTPGSDTGVTGAVTFLLGNVVVVVAVSLAPPRALLPAWARRRLESPPTDVEPPVPGAVPALHASHVRGRVSWPRWRWRIDGIPGHVWVADGQLLFRACGDGDATGGIPELDEDEVDQLELQLGDDARLSSPRGGWWTRRRLDVDLPAVDDCRVTARRPWSRAGLVTFEVQGRRPVRLWVSRADHVRDAIARARQRGSQRPADDGRR